MAEERTNPFLSKAIGKPDTGSRPKAEAAADRAQDQNHDADERQQEGWPVNANGKPMIKAEMSAAELIPTGPYANVSIGPVRMWFLIDPDRKVGPQEPYWTPQERDVIAKAFNEAAEIVEGDVVAVQRNLVVENLQEQVAAENGK